MHKIIIASLAAVGLGLSGTAMAQDVGALGSDFNAVDTDRNGGVSWAEFALVFSDVTEAQFNLADSNGDGELSADEFDSIALSTGAVSTMPAPVNPADVPLNSLTYDDSDS